MTGGTGERLMRAAELTQVREQKYAARKRVNKVALSLSLLAMMFGIFWLIWILWDTLRLGVGGMAWATLTQMTPPPNEVGGLANAIVRLVSDGAAGHVRRHADRHHGRHLPGRVRRKGWLGSLTRFVNDILLSAPSIVIGLFVYAVVVARYKSFRAGPARWRWR